MKKFLLSMLIIVTVVSGVLAQPAYTVLNNDEEGWQGVNFLHNKFEKLRHNKYLDKNSDNGNQMNMDFLLADIIASGLSNDELSSTATDIARNYILTLKGKIRGTANKLDGLIRLRGAGSDYYAVISSSDSADFVKTLEYESAAYKTYDSSHAIFVKKNPAVFKNRYKDELAYFLTLNEKKRNQYVNDFRGANPNMRMIIRKFMRIDNTYTLTKSNWNNLPCALIQSSPYKKESEPAFYNLNVRGPEFKKQAEAALTENGFILKDNEWVRTAKSPAYITCVATELIVNDNNILVKFYYDK
ncbi:MAG: hypothetical protein ABJA78_02335 [Ferruginibacter sp.]